MSRVGLCVSQVKKGRAINNGRGDVRFLDAFDVAFAVAADLHSILSRRLDIVPFTDSRQLFDALVKGKRTAEQNSTVEIASARQSYRNFEINGVGLVQCADNPADRLTKVVASGALGMLIESQMDRTLVVEWIERTTRERNTSNLLLCQCDCIICDGSVCHG